uniref:ARAD1B01188p n=1 Tax=Blastobotrys adeninivorans TaxID=409370 RepID=A0A060T9Q8_BLAAD
MLRHVVRTGGARLGLAAVGRPLAGPSRLASVRLGAPAASIVGYNGIRFNSTNNSASAGSQFSTEIGAVANSASDAVAGAASQVADVAQAAGQAVQAVGPDQVGYFQSVGLAQSWWWPPDFFHHIFELTHVYTGLPWWATIAVVTVGMRALMLPMYIKGADATAKMAKIQPELNNILEQYQKSKDPIEGQKALLRRRSLMKEHNIKTRHMFAPMLSAPFFIGVFAGLNRMAAVPVADMVDQGLAWFSNLAIPDPYLGLQIGTAIIYSLTMKMGGEMGGGAGSPAMGAMRKIMPWLPFIAIPVMMKVPAATCLYFAYNGVLSLLQTLAFKSTTFRNMVGMAPVVKVQPNANSPTSTVDAFKKMYENIKEKAEDQARKNKEEAERIAAAKAHDANVKSRQFVQMSKKSRKPKA